MGHDPFAGSMTFPQRLPETVGKHRYYVVIDNSSKITVLARAIVLRLGSTTTWRTLLKGCTLRKVENRWSIQSSSEKLLAKFRCRNVWVTPGVARTHAHMHTHTLPWLAYFCFPPGRIPSWAGLYSGTILVAGWASPSSFSWGRFLLASCAQNKFI